MTAIYRVILRLICLVPMIPVAMAQDYRELEDTRHDLALYVTTRRADRTEDAQCVFCHLPRRGSARIGRWHEEQADALFDYPYDRPSPRTPKGKPDGATLICLSCHDGTIALGDVYSRGRSSSADKGVSRTDLSDGHPVSLLYDEALLEFNHELASLKNLPAIIKLDPTGKIQCTTCHDPHDDTYGKFLVMDNRRTALCLTCHRKTDWPSSTHASVNAVWNLNGPNPWTYSDGRGSVADHGCFNCHTPHSAGNGRYLLNFNTEEDNCLACHDGNVASDDINADFKKLSRHPLDETTGVHAAGEKILTRAADRHVECSDCHNPHAVTATATGDLPGTLRKVQGIDANGGEKDEIAREYELCFRCHGDVAGKRAMPVPRVHDQSNTRLQFNNGNPSFHPVLAPGNNTNVPSLIAPLIENSTIKCTDCHGSDNGASSGGNGPDGPHGSIYPHLLARAYRTQDRTPESPTAYALCYRCHDRVSILGDQSFSLHKLHVRDENAPCSVCHDPHGISSTQGNELNNSHLINFDTSVVLPNSNRELNFEDRGNFRGSCSLTCHNSEHREFSY